MPKYKSKLSTSKKKKPTIQKKIENLESKKLEENEISKKFENEKLEILKDIKVFIEKVINPEILCNFFETADKPTRIFNILKLISSQAVGKKVKFHENYIKSFEKKDTMYLPFKDISENAKNLTHLIRALQDENEEDPQSQFLFLSIKEIIVSVLNFIQGNLEGMYYKKSLKYLEPLLLDLDKFMIWSFNHKTNFFNFLKNQC